MIYNLNEYNASYRKDGTLVWEKIGEKTGKKGIRKKKNYLSISIEDIEVGSYTVDEQMQKEAREHFENTGQITPVFLSYDMKLIGGFEFFELAKSMGRKRIPFVRMNKMNKKETRNFAKEVHFKKIGNKKYSVPINDGRRIFLSMNKYKEYNEICRMAKKAGLILDVNSEYKFKILDRDGKDVSSGRYYQIKITKNKILKYMNRGNDNE